MMPRTSRRGFVTEAGTTAAAGRAKDRDAGKLRIVVKRKESEG